METMFAAGRRSLPPVPRRALEQELPRDAAAPDQVAREAVTAVAVAIGPVAETSDADQDFVSRLRATAALFAAAAGAETAVVREAVPPARHRRARCRVVLRRADGAEADLTFLGPAGRTDAGTGAGFGTQIRRWLAEGQHREPAWMVADGVAVDVTAWLLLT